MEVETEAERLRETRNVPTTREVGEPPFSQVGAGRIVFKDRENSLRASFCLRVLGTSGEMTWLVSEPCPIPTL